MVNGHTCHQLSVLARLLQTKDNSLCRLYIAIPKSATTLLKRVLRGLNMEEEEHIVCMYVADCFVAVNEQEEECEIHQGRCRALPHQEKGTNFLRDRNAAALFDEQGLGKTKQLIDAITQEAS